MDDPIENKPEKITELAGTEKIHQPEVGEAGKLREEKILEKEGFEENARNPEQTPERTETQQPQAPTQTVPKIKSLDIDLNNPGARDLEQQIQLFVRTALGGNESKVVEDAKKTFSDNNYALDRFHDLLLEAKNKNG